MNVVNYEKQNAIKELKSTIRIYKNRIKLLENLKVSKDIQNLDSKVINVKLQKVLDNTVDRLDFKVYAKHEVNSYNLLVIKFNSKLECFDLNFGTDMSKNSKSVFNYENFIIEVNANIERSEKKLDIYTNELKNLDILVEEYLKISRELLELKNRTSEVFNSHFKALKNVY